MGSAMQSLADDLSVTNSSSQTISTDSRFFDMYAGIYDNLETYGVVDQYEVQSASLANLIFARTLKNAEIQSIEYQNNGFLVTVTGDGIPLSAFQGQLWTNAVIKATGSFLSSHFFEAAGTLFKGEDAIKEMLFKDFGEDIFQAVEDEIDGMKTRNMEYVIQVQYDNEKWNLEIVSEKETGAQPEN